MRGLRGATWVSLAIVFAGCGASAGTSLASRTPSPAASLSPSRAAVSSTASVSATSQMPDPSGTGHCRLPVSQLPPDPNAPSRRPVGFLNYPEGTLSVDTDAVTYDSGTDRYETVRQPKLYGQDAAAYNVEAGRWLPSKPALISGDGSQYVYLSPAGRDVHLVQVGSRSDRSIFGLSGDFLIAYNTNGLIAWVLDSSDFVRSTGRLLLVDPQTGSSRQLASGQVQWSVADKSAIFGTDLNSADPSPLIQSPIEPAMSVAPDRAWRLELSDGRLMQWFYRPGSLVEIAGIDSAGRVMVVAVNNVRTEVWRLDGPESGQMIYQGPGSGQPDPTGLHNYGLNGPGIADGSVFWLGTDSGILRYSERGGFRLVYGGQATPAGPCN